MPDVRSCDDTKYFDEDEPISDVDDATSVSDNVETEQELHAVSTGTARVTQVDGAQCQNRFPISPTAGDHVNGNKNGNGKAKEKKRARDKVLRDKEVSRKVLDIRKQGAFIGYTYRRPQLLRLEEERGRQRQRSARSLVPNFE